MIDKFNNFFMTFKIKLLFCTTKIMLKKQIDPFSDINNIYDDIDELKT